MSECEKLVSHAPPIERLSVLGNSTNYSIPFRMVGYGSHHRTSRRNIDEARCTGKSFRRSEPLEVLPTGHAGSRFINNFGLNGRNSRVRSEGNHRSYISPRIRKLGGSSLEVGSLALCIEPQVA